MGPAVHAPPLACGKILLPCAVCLLFNYLTFLPKELHKDDPYPVQFIAAMQHMADRSSQWRSSNGLYTPPHGDQGLYYAMLVVDDANEVSESERRIVDLSQAWDRDLCHGYR